MNVLRRVGGGGGGSSSSSNANASQANAGFDVNASSSGANGLAGSGTGGLGHADHSDGLGGGGADGSSSPPDKHFGLENVSAPRLHWTILVLPGGELPLIRFVLSCPVLSCTQPALRRQRCIRSMPNPSVMDMSDVLLLACTVRQHLVRQ